jgi:hypothetical protein
MTLKNLLRIGRLKANPLDKDEIQRLLGAARRSLHDSQVPELRPESRFDLAYKAIMQTALALLMANGYRPDTNQIGHHVTVLQSLPKTIGLSSDRVVVLDSLRRKRNLSDYMGENIDDGSAANCQLEAQRLLDDAMEWLARVHPELVD